MFSCSYFAGTESQVYFLRHKYKLEHSFVLFVNVTRFTAEDQYQNFTQDIEFSAVKGKSIFPMQKALRHEGMETKSLEGLG